MLSKNVKYCFDIYWFLKFLKNCFLIEKIILSTSFEEVAFFHLDFLVYGI